MSDKEYKGGMHNGLSTLIKAIETLYGDVDVYIDSLIEQVVNQLKK